MVKTKKQKIESSAQEIKLTDTVISELTKLTNELLELLGTAAKAELSEDKENDALNVNINANSESGLLIGNRGRTLSSLQTIISLLIRQKLGGWKRVLVNISDWREKEESRLRDLATKVADRAKTTGEPQPLYNLTAGQRRTIHMALAEDSGVKTESSGEGKDRYLIVSPK